MEVKTLAVVGAGQMGAGIAQVAAQSGLSVVLVDVGAEFLQKGLAGIRAQLDRALSKGKIRADEAEAALGRVRGASSAQEASHAQFAVEAVTENEAVKKKVFQDLAKALGPDAILATNTSSIPITRIA
ncbi:MAG: 3-hydroxyacyl-CoA dehydrogenase family protein, partial [Myxococcales bacterium]